MYTHYFQQKKTVADSQWSKITEDVNKLIADAEEKGIVVQFEYDAPGTPPQVDSEMIRFNGAGGKGHETFFIRRALLSDFNFCKTARKPYDLVVCGVLIVAEKHAPGCYGIGSDGSYGKGEYEMSEWTPAIEWVTKVLGPGYDVPPEIRRS